MKQFDDNPVVSLEAVKINIMIIERQDVFFKDIYFVLEDGLVYRDMFLQVPKDPRYSKYFVR